MGSRTRASSPVRAFLSLRPQTPSAPGGFPRATSNTWRSEEHTSELQSRLHLVCRLLLEKKKKIKHLTHNTFGCLARFMTGKWPCIKKKYGLTNQFVWGLRSLDS